MEKSRALKKVKISRVNSLVTLRKRRLKVKTLSKMSRVNHLERQRKMLKAKKNKIKKLTLAAKKSRTAVAAVKILMIANCSDLKLY